VDAFRRESGSCKTMNMRELVIDKLFKVRLRRLRLSIYVLRLTTFSLVFLP
jgi:hypothetical protein